MIFYKEDSETSTQFKSGRENLQILEGNSFNVSSKSSGNRKTDI